MILVAQDKDYNCASFSMKFFLSLFRIESNTQELEEIMLTTKEEGTSHSGISKVMKHYNLSYISLDNASIEMLKMNLPAIVNYQYFDNGEWDGHYAVIISSIKNDFIIYNPANGVIEIENINSFERNWYSKRYGKRWFLSII